MEWQLQSLSAQMDFEKEDILENPDWEYVGTYTDIKSGRTIVAKETRAYRNLHYQDDR